MEIDPRQHDEAQAQLWLDWARAEARHANQVDRMHGIAGDRKEYLSRRPSWKMTHAQILDQLKAAVAMGDAHNLSYGQTPSEAMRRENELAAEMAKIMLAIEDGEQVYRKNGAWTRFFPCQTRDGHIHASLRGCPTVRWSTDMGWRPDLSGHTVAEAMAELGEALCTFCFPDAPSDWKAKTLGQVKDERTRAEREAARAQRDAVKYAKRLRDDEVFRVREDGRFSERIETVAACKQALRHEVELRDYCGRGEHPSHGAWVEGAKQAKVVLLAREARHAGHGATQAEIDKIIATAVKKYRKEGARI